MSDRAYRITIITLCAIGEVLAITVLVGLWG